MPALTTALPNLIVAFDDALGDDFSQPAKLLMFLDVDGKAFDLGVKELPAGMHPLEELLGFVAPEDCLAIGAIAHGWASRDVTTRPSRAGDRVRMRAAHVVCRNGTEVGGFRRAGGELELQPATVGMVPDALRRTLGLATPAAEHPPTELSAAEWLDAILDDIAAADAPPEPLRSWDEARWQVVTRERAVAGVSPTAAAWMDAGMFARWMVPTYPPTPDHLAAVRRVVDTRTYRRIRTVLRSWGVFS
jgi:hypothetical protein